MCQGKLYGQIAAELGVGIETVRTHAASVRRKLGVSRKAELIGLQEPIPPEYHPNITRNRG
jgi:DNA-binding CsgD family transcriptional regulator